MGNSAVITTRENYENNGIGVYVHWNGGRDSVEAFLEYCRLRHFHFPEIDPRGWARLVQVIANYFGGNLSVGVEDMDRLNTDMADHGVFLIQGWRIVGREMITRAEQHDHDLNEMLMELDACQPEKDQLGKEYLLDSEDRQVKEIQIGDEVWVPGYEEGIIERGIVVGYGKPLDYHGNIPCDHDVPCVDVIWRKVYLTDPIYRVVKRG